MNKLLYLVSFLSLGACREKFMPGIQFPPTGYLVVEGLVNSGNGPASINLTRTNRLDDSAEWHETGAIIFVEGTDSSSYAMMDLGNGLYGSSQLHLNSAIPYRLRITTKDGRAYLSDYVPVLTTPSIDSISWRLKNGGVQIYANTHDSQTNPLYCEWNYTESWEFHSTYFPNWKYDTINGTIVVGPASPDFLKYTCWKSLSSTSLLTGSSAGLSKNSISEMPIEFLPPGSQKLSVEYSILVNQYALTQGAYQFLQEMKMNTEETGSIFDPQPSQFNGNIHSVTNPSETVVGYFNIASRQTTRIFIDNSQVPGWVYATNCKLDSILPPVYHLEDALLRFEVPVSVLNINPAKSTDSFLAVSAYCVDCTLTGSNQKPSFWP